MSSVFSKSDKLVTVSRRSREGMGYAATRQAAEMKESGHSTVRSSFMHQDDMLAGFCNQRADPSEYIGNRIRLLSTAPILPPPLGEVEMPPQQTECMHGRNLG